MKRKILNELKESNGDQFSTVGQLRDWINDENLEDGDNLEVWAENYDDSAEAIMTIKRVREETDVEYAERFNREENERKQRDIRTKALRYQTYLQMKEEFDAPPENVVGEVA